ncbi:CatB-related O-acetyltransferase [Pseudomonas sp. 5P_3.1_Bac2]|uniref:CatB-related O-acetyltransferase n=1 Tax=Pseudomonas sp. 5P_3.1_Bac2 TaxID=2971617 RepID=UPI0021CA8AD2|nr:CatB-related O-acetyltransferase [Pseudomonas sp. 5P_3.1_Bac2]MCU1717473.1 CatB-related O-acetyltransferase [Pseudomonas sp. 5P_3.1_Bac2]
MLNFIELIRHSRFKKAIRKFGGKVANGPLAFSKKAQVSLEQQVFLGQVRIESPALSIGAHTYIRSESHLQLVQSIGRFCSIGQGCMLGQDRNNHPTDWVSSHPFQYEGNSLVYAPTHSYCQIGHDVWIGHGATVLSGVNVGTGAIIGTQAMVTRDVPPYAIVGGNPAKIIRYRHSEALIERLLRSHWWEFDLALLRSLPLNQPEAFLDALEQSQAQRTTYKTLRIAKQRIAG